ncbi:MAG: hypothetical protein ACRCS5_14255 [Sphingomonas sp.]|jgi:hypothetical protein|uniref:Uncharacterized protein n=1 Tax=Sphingomonas echinoides TaxID=59803 RepID=A0ABU4PN94_9SPHN|nr:MULTISPECIES: hypothetical protein [Sphingomonas]MDR6849057.1 hypothetical protein [Sphingomonas sp. BE137]MDR7258025.1 hypothetical protein [Sphingomonas sp. BE270]MDX5984593.1 hypothetical protein [Sphingomonas echinoides]RUN77642.1 hypothetical protein EJC47_04390 [Sphingomonas sp. TF3]
MNDDTPELPNTTRRRALMLGAVGAAAVVSIRPALASTAASISTCEIPVPDSGRAGSYIAADGTVVPAGTRGAFAPPGRPFKGEEVKTALAGGQLPGTNYEQSRAYTNYIRRLQSGTSGFTCFASLQMPRG